MSLTDDIKTLRARTQAGMMDCKNALKDANGNPVYCSEKLQKHVEGEDFNGTAFDIGTAELYKQLYFKITEGREMTVTPEMAAMVISVCETVHAANPMPLKF